MCGCGLVTVAAFCKRRVCDAVDVGGWVQELDLYDMQTVDPDLGRTLFEMQGLIQRKQFLEGHGGKREEVEALNFRGSKLEDLCLDFTLPGYPEYELKSNGREVAVRGEAWTGW